MPRANPPRPRQPAPSPPEVVDPGWILKAVGAVLAFGLLCAYITVCTVFYLEQWEFVLHPSRLVPQTPASLQLAFTPVRFSDDRSGQPQLSGWWIPSDSAADPTVLMLHREDGSMSDALPAVRELHNARLNVFVFDYRGYGQSGGRHPSEALMQADTDAALRFLLDSKHAYPGTLLVYGAGLGASLAVRLCGTHAGIAGLVLEAADGDTLSRVKTDQRSRIVPVGMLFRERFPLADPIATLRTPKLLISYTKGDPPVYAQRAADPKMTVELGVHGAPGATGDLVQQTAAVRRFLDTYIPQTVPTLDPSPNR